MKKITKFSLYGLLYLAIIFLLAVMFIVTAKADLIKPNNTFEPYEVVKIQLKSLKDNSEKNGNIGIKQTWEFAHPNNKKITGPLEKFKKMIYSDSYRMLIGHENNEIEILSEDVNRSVYKVYILSKDKKRYSYIWQIEKVEIEGDLKNCWMTTSVSSPEFLGEVI